MEINKRKYTEINHINEKQHSPLSFQQERVFYLSQLQPESTLWNKISCKNIKGNIKIEKLSKAVNKLAERHMTLRTKVTFADNSPIQFIAPLEEIILGVANFSNLPHDESNKAALDFLNKEYATPIYLNKDSLFRAKLVVISENEYIIILKLHHIISDATTFQILWKDLKDIYNSMTEGEATLPKLNLDYYDYAIWQRESFAEKNTKEQEEYWLNQFDGEMPILNLPTDLPAPPHISFRGAVEKRALSKELVKGLQGLSLKKRVILFSTLLSAYYVLLQKYCHQEDIIIGTVFSGRNYNKELRNMAGFYVNTVAIRMSIEDEQTFEEVLKQTQEKINSAYFMQDYPFERIIQKKNLDRQNSRNPLFRAMFNMVTSYKEKEGFEGTLEESWEEPDITSTQVDLLFDVHNNNDEIEICIEYNTDIFKKERIKDILKHYTTLLQDIVIKPESKVKELDILKEEEKRQIIENYNNTIQEYPKNKILQELFEEQVEKTPSAIAVAFDDKEITYKQLNQRANQLGRRLKEIGVKPNQLVGVRVERSIDMIVAILGVLKAGGAYLPMEPSYPDERIKYILQNSDANCIITQSKYKKIEDCNIEVIHIEEERINEYDFSNLEKVNAPEDLAYTIYTSGSSGRPKGVMITHFAVINTIIDMNNRYEIGNEDRIIGLSSVSFDLSVYDIFGALSTGATLVEIHDQRDVRAIAEILENKKITFWNSVPAIMDMLVQNVGENFRNTSLRLVLLSGDWIPLNLPDKIRTHFPNAEIISLGGATEASIWSIYYPVKEVREEWKSIPYGMPLANQTFYVMNNAMQLCPYEVPGELYIGGVGVAKGYMNDIEKTKNAFITHLEFGVIYKTGDWGSLNKEGYIEFLGRKDQQIKIRGYRIELGEIEKTLLSHPTIKEAVALVREDTPGNKRIAAYIVMKPDMDIAIDELIKYLKNWLSSYMMPSAFMKLDSLPLSANGKVNVKTLPIPEEVVQTEKKNEVPITFVESKLIEITENILNVKNIGINDNFFNIGGNSLLIIRFISEIEEAFKISLSLIDFIDLPVLRDMAKIIEKVLPADI